MLKPRSILGFLVALNIVLLGAWVTPSPSAALSGEPCGDGDGHCECYYHHCLEVPYEVEWTCTVGMCPG